MNNKKQVFHIGKIDLTNPRPKTSYSLEGSGLSVSLHPNEWRRIAKLSGDTFKLSKSNSNFYTYKKKDLKTILKWCMDHQFIIPSIKYQAVINNEEGEEEYMEFDTSEEAQNESEKVLKVKGYIFGPKGIEYWHSFCSSKVDNSFAKDYAIIFYAEAMGFDGVWWNEILDPAIYSAPRGVIFQSKINEWNIDLISNT